MRGLSIQLLSALGLLLAPPSATAGAPTGADFGVVFGDSLAEGAPSLHSRLHANRSGAIALDLRSRPGQLSGELGRELSDRGPLDGLNRWVNHGVGGQTSDQLLKRLKRDVLAGPRTGKEAPRTPGATLDSLPKTVLISVGTMDMARARLKESKSPPIARSFEQALARLKSNTLSMVKQLDAAGVSPIFLTLPVHGKSFEGDTPEGVEKRDETIRAFNQWLKSELVTRHGARVFDFAEFCERRKRQDRDRYFVDDVHPSKEGYTTLAREIALKFSKKSSPAETKASDGDASPAR